MTISDCLAIQLISSSDYIFSLSRKLTDILFHAVHSFRDEWNIEMPMTLIFLIILKYC